MVQIAAVAAVLAGLVHLYVFVLQSLLWTTERARTIFGTSEQEAATTRTLALNQGFYNLFLAVGALLGVGLLLADATTAGSTLVLTATGSMVLAALVLVGSTRGKTRAALAQGTFATIAVTTLTLHLV